MNLPHYRIIISWDTESEAFIAQVPALPGCMSHGDTYEEALANIQEAMTGWLTVAREDGDPIPEPDGPLEEIRAVLPLVNVSKLARIAGINSHTLASKLRRGGPFTKEETVKLREALKS